MFSNNEAIKQAFENVGLTSSGIIIDEAGTVVDCVDTFYGWEEDQSFQHQKGLSYLVEQIEN